MGRIGKQPWRYKIISSVTWWACLYLVARFGQSLSFGESVAFASFVWFLCWGLI